MTQLTNVIVLGDRGTAERAEMITAKAAESGTEIADWCVFEQGEAIGQDDLGQVDAVVAALSRALTTRTFIWVPFPVEDLRREQHLRRLTLVLQRHGLNLLMGPDLTPCNDFGFNEIDFALRQEVRAVDRLDRVATAAAGVEPLSEEIERVLAENPAPASSRSESEGRSGVFEVGERFYSTGEVAQIFGKSDHWVSRGLRENVFTYPDGSPIEPIRIGKGGRRRFTVPVLCEMARSCYRRGTLTEQQLASLLAELSRSAG
jgi:hypothetical protein